MRTALPVLLFALVALGPTVPALGDPPPTLSEEGLRCSGDFLVFFEGERDQALVWITIAIPLRELFFEPAADGTDVLVSWKVLDGERQVAGDVLRRRASVKPEQRDELSFLQAIPVRLSPGRYRFDVEVGQPDSDRKAVLTRNIRIQPISGSEVALSSLYFTAEPPRDLDARSDRLAGHPLVSRMVGADAPVLTLVGDIYAPRGCRERYRVSYRVVNDAERTVQKREQEIPCEGFRTLAALPIEIGDLAFGDYRVEVTLQVPEQGDKIYREIWFGADETLLPIRVNFERTLDIVEVIASGDELETLRSTGPDDRERAWTDFWARRDPDPTTAKNEFREDFFRRLRYANQHFSTAVTPGWKSDRGYVLLKHGEPERVERTAFSVDRPAIEVWHYPDGRWFRFVDEMGLGDFRLSGGDS